MNNDVYEVVFSAEHIDTLQLVLKNAYAELFEHSSGNLAKTIAAQRVKSLINIFKECNR